MKKDMPLEGLRWSRDSGSTLCDTPQNGRSRTGWGGEKIRLYRFPSHFLPDLVYDQTTSIPPTMLVIRNIISNVFMFILFSFVENIRYFGHRSLFILIKHFCVNLGCCQLSVS